MAATLVAFFALGFFAASILTLVRFVALVGTAAMAVSVIGWVQGLSILRGLELGFGSFGLAQVGFALGLAWVAVTSSRAVPD